MQGTKAQETLKKFESLKETYATPNGNSPFPPNVMNDISKMVEDIDWPNTFSKEDGAELKAALGFDSYKKALTGDYSEFELVHPVLRNHLAMKQEALKSRCRWQG